MGGFGLLEFADGFVRSTDEVGGELGFVRFRPIVDHGPETVTDGRVNFSLSHVAVAPHQLGIGSAGAGLVERDVFFVLSGSGGELALGVKLPGGVELKSLHLAQLGKSLNLNLLKPGQLGRLRRGGQEEANCAGANQSESFFAVNHRLYSECA